MAPLTQPRAPAADCGLEAVAGTPVPDLEVLVTGFGPFGKTSNNPSWSSASQLHEVTLFPSISSQSRHKKRNIHIQSINLPVVYPNTLDVVPRIHGNTPASPHASMQVDDRGPRDEAQGDGKHPYPQGYSPRLQHPHGGYDLVIHVGLGLDGGFRVEKQAHKEGYKKQDAFGQSPPPIHTDHAPIEANVGGFGKGYEEFGEEESTEIDVDSLVSHLESQGCGPIYTSFDPGRYLCDFTYYCSLVEAKRASPRGSMDEVQKRTQVLFIHVPSDGNPQSVEDGRRMLVQAIRWILRE